MRVLVVSITDPSKEKLVTDILNEIEGVEVRPRPAKAKHSARRSPKAIKPMTQKEKKFVKGLTRAFKDMNDHIAGKKKLKTLDEFLNEL
jgi:hypothetical protein